MNPIILFDNILTAGTLSADTTASGYSVNNLIDYRTYTKWKASNASDVNINFTVGASSAVRRQTGWYIKLQNNAVLMRVSGGSDTADTIGIFNHNLGTIGATIEVQVLDGASYTTLKTINPTDDDPILETFNSSVYGVWRIALSGMSAAPEIAVIFLGVRVTFPWRPEAPVTPVRETIRVKSEISETGNLLGSLIAFNPKSLNHRWVNITRTWFNTYFVPFWDNHAKLMYPFFYAWDLDNRPDDIVYGKVSEEMAKAEMLSLLDYTDELNLVMDRIAS